MHHEIHCVCGKVIGYRVNMLVCVEIKQGGGKSRRAPIRHYYKDGHVICSCGAKMHVDGNGERVVAMDGVETKFS